MSRKSDLYNQLKDAGYKFEHHYREYTTPHLLQLLEERGIEPVPKFTPEPEVDLDQTQDMPKLDLQAMFTAFAEPEPPLKAKAATETVTQRSEELPGQRLNVKQEDEPIRTDERGRVWYQEEVLKPAYPKPRGRRVLKYLDTGVKTETVQNGEYVETFEVAGVGEAKPAEVKITLPSFQVGIYRDPRFPFKIHCYNGREGFDLFDVQNYWGGSEMVPAVVKRVYIENDLCYEIRSVVRAIQAEHRQLQLTGRL